MRSAGLTDLNPQYNIVIQVNKNLRPKRHKQFGGDDVAIWGTYEEIFFIKKDVGLRHSRSSRLTRPTWCIQP